MEKIITTGRVFYGIAMASVGIHQLFYADFTPFLFPQWPHQFPGYHVMAVVFSMALITASIFIIIGKNTRTLSLILAGVLLLMLFGGWVPFQYIILPYKKTHLGVWVLPLKELALAGGALAVAGSLPGNENNKKPAIIRLLEKLIPLRGIFFATTMILFGISHFLYPQTVADMVPSWMPAHYFWTYFAGIALIAGGTAIAIRVWLKWAGILMGAMILLWFVFLHVPGAIEYPLVDQGNLITAAFSALAFSGIAFVLAGSGRNKQVQP